MTISVKKLVYLLIILAGALVPIQPALVNLFKLPVFIQFYYLFLIMGAALCLFIPFSRIIKSIDKTFFILFSTFLLITFLSLLFNYDDVMARGNTIVYMINKNLVSSSFMSPDFRMIWGFYTVFLLLLYTTLLFIFLNFKDAIKVLLKSMIIVGVISSIYSIYQLIAYHFNLPFANLFTSDRPVIAIFGMRRVEGIFYEPGPQATFLSPIFCILAFQLMENNENKLLYSKLLTKIFIGLISFVMLCTLSPIGFLTPIIGGGIAILLNFKQFTLFIINNLSKIAKALFSLLMVFLLFFIITNSNRSGEKSIIDFLIDSVKYAIITENDPMVYTNPDMRSVRNHAGIEMFKDHMAWGVGPNASTDYYFKYIYYARTDIKLLKSAMVNVYIKILAEWGLIGFIVFFMIILYPIFLYIKRIKHVGNKNLIDSLLIAHCLYLCLSFFSTLQFFLQQYWLIYVPLIILLKQNSQNILYIQGETK